MSVLIRLSSLMSPRDCYACDPEPFEEDLDKCQGFLLQCRLFFFHSTRAFFTLEEVKINYIIGLLRGRALVWAQASSLRTHLNTLSLDEFIKRFERIFDRLDHAGCVSDRLFTRSAQ